MRQIKDDLQAGVALTERLRSECADNETLGEALGIFERSCRQMLDIAAELETRLQDGGPALSWSDALEAVPDPMFIHDAGRRLVRANRAYLEAAGASLASCLGRPYFDIFPRRTTPLPEPEETHAAQEIALDDGRVFLHRGYSLGHEHGVHLLQEITDLKRAEQRLARLNRTYAVLSECDQLLVQAPREQELLRAFCDNIINVGGYRFTWVGWAESGPEKRVRPIAHAGLGADYLDDITVTWGEDAHGQGPTGRAIRSGRPAMARDTDADPVFAPWREAAQRRGFRATIALPLTSNEETLGVLTIYADSVGGFDDEEVELLTGLAEDLAFGICNARERKGRAEAEALLHIRDRAIESARNGVLIADAARLGNPIIYVNPAFEKITGFRTEEALGQPLDFLWSDDASQIELERVNALLRQHRDGHSALRSTRRDGSTFWCELYVTPVPDENGRVGHYVAILNDITEHKRYEEELAYRSQHDALTGLPNRTLLNDRLAQAITYAERYRRTAAVLFLDIDQFKVINESLGHGSGDDLIREVARRLLGCAREGDTVARYSGDEFVMVLPDVATPEDVSIIARRVLERVAEPLDLAGHDLRVTICIGASLYPRDGTDAGMLLKNADAAMYRAKEVGRSTFQFFTAEMNSRAMERLNLETQLRRAIDNGELRLHYQPQVDLASGEIVGAEALVRWEHPELGLVPPVRFIPLAEQTGLVVPLGEWVLRTACAQNRAWQEAGLRPVCMAVNVSARQLNDPDLATTVSAILQETGLEPCRLELELTETALMDDPEKMLGRLNELKAVGAQLSIDDFGTGYSSLSYLSAFPFDKLKIDQSFIRDVTANPKDAEITVTVNAMARALKLRVIAEGVETEGQLHFLLRLGCDEIQGFYFSRPVEVEEFEAMLREDRRLDVTPRVAGGSLRSLLVLDDEPEVNDALQQLLHGEGYKVFCARTPEEAFELLAIHPVAVAIADQRMPTMSGVEFLGRVEELYPEVVRLVLSAEADLDTIAEALVRGAAYKFLVKPWDGEELLGQIKEAFAEFDRRQSALDGVRCTAR